MNWLNDIWTQERVLAFRKTLTARGGRDDIQHNWEQVDPSHREWLENQILMGTLPMKTTGAWVVPVLSEEACDYLVAKTEDMNWQENVDELPQYRIPELILHNHDAVLDCEVKEALFYGLAPFLMGIWGRLPTRYASLQMTRYMKENRKAGAYHIDQDADYTAVITLNDEFTGGGTALRDGLFGEIIVPPLPKGYALVFSGRQVSHMGLEVTRGTRRLLTVWANNDGDQW